MSVDLKHLYASKGLSTIGSSFILNDVFISNGHPVLE